MLTSPRIAKLAFARKLTCEGGTAWPRPWRGRNTSGRPSSAIARGTCAAISVLTPLLPSRRSTSFWKPKATCTVRLQLHALAYNLGNFLRTLALPKDVEHWSLTTLREKLIKIGAKVVRHGRYITFQLAEVAIPRALFAEILRLINRLRPAPLPP